MPAGFLKGRAQNTLANAAHELEQLIRTIRTTSMRGHGVSTPKEASASAISTPVAIDQALHHVGLIVVARRQPYFHQFERFLSDAG